MRPHESRDRSLDLYLFDCASARNPGKDERVLGTLTNDLDITRPLGDP
jgi:hypothetical protein